MSKSQIQYEVISLPTNRERLSPQLKALVETIEGQMNFDLDSPTRVISRDDVYESWLEKIGLESNDKVFASYIHQLIQFAFLDRLNVKPKKVMSIDDSKKMMMKQLSLMSKEDREEFIKGL